MKESMKESMKDSVIENFYQLDQETKADYLYLYLVKGYIQDYTAKNSKYGIKTNTGFDVSACLQGTDIVGMAIRESIRKGKKYL